VDIRDRYHRACHGRYEHVDLVSCVPCLIIVIGERRLSRAVVQPRS
jgi:hypothetical protein